MQAPFSLSRVDGASARPQLVQSARTLNSSLCSCTGRQSGRSCDRRAAKKAAVAQASSGNGTGSNLPRNLPRKGAAKGAAKESSTDSFFKKTDPRTAFGGGPNAVPEVKANFAAPKGTKDFFTKYDPRPSFGGGPNTVPKPAPPSTRRNTSESFFKKTDPRVKYQQGTDRDPRPSSASRQASQDFNRGVNNMERGADRLANNFRGAAENLAEGADMAARRASGAQAELQKNAQNLANRGQAVFEEASDRVSSQMKEGVEGVEGFAQQAQQQFTQFQKDLDTPGPAAPFADAPLGAKPARPADLAEKDFAKLRVLYAVAGLDRGFSANESAVSAVETSVTDLISASEEKVLLNWTPRKQKPSDREAVVPSTMKSFNGTWRLIYSSAFAKPTNNARPSPPFSSLLPTFTFGQVYQVVDSSQAQLDNVVEFYSRFNPTLPGLPPTEPVVLTLTLRHSFEATGGPSVQITFEDTMVKATGGVAGILGKLPLPNVLPQLPEPLQPSRASRSSSFDILYLDEDLRITRGAGRRDELRVFVRS